MSEPQTVQVGSLVFCHSPDLIGWAIRIGQRLRWRPASQWNHVAIAIETGTNPLVAQATTDGCTITAHLSDLEGGPIYVVPPPIDISAFNVAKFAKLQTSQSYGWLELFGIVIDQLLPRWLRFQIGRDGTWVCSALAGESWRFGGWFVAWPNIYQVAPAELALAVGVDETIVYPKRNRRIKKRRMH